MNNVYTPHPEVRSEVKSLLLSSEAFRRLPLAIQQQIARDTALVADYLAAPEGIEGQKLPVAAPVPARRDSYGRALEGEGNTGATYTEAADRVSEIGQGKFKAQAAREGAAVAGALLKEVKFPAFVAGLIKGVFHAIVESSIEQMEAYGRLVADVAKSLNQFRDENVSDNQGRDHLVEMFPDTFEIGVDPMAEGGARPGVRVRDGVDEDAALKKINATLPAEGGPITSLDDEAIEDKLVQAARTQLATSRQQLLATMVLMGINRIVVTDGKISAKILYDFQSRDSRKMQRSAAAFDYAKNKDGNLQYTQSGEIESEETREADERSRSYERGKDSASYEDEERTGGYYAKGKHKYEQKPVMTAMSTASETSDAALQTRASLAGVVEVNFKSDYFPLEKMADSFQIAQIQNAAQPGQGNPAAGTPTQAGNAAKPATTTPPAPGR
jgi:hypothetical protein